MAKKYSSILAPKTGQNRDKPRKNAAKKGKQAISEEIDLFSLAAGEGFEVPDVLFFRVIPCLFACIFSLFDRSICYLLPPDVTWCRPV